GARPELKAGISTCTSKAGPPINREVSDTLGPTGLSLRSLSAMIQASNNASVMMITNIFLPRIVLQPLASSEVAVAHAVVNLFYACGTTIRTGTFFRITDFKQNECS